MNNDAIAVALDFLKSQMVELKSEIKTVLLQQRSLEEEIRKGYVTKEQFGELKEEVKGLREDFNALNLKTVAWSASASTVVWIVVWLINYFLAK